MSFLFPSLTITFEAALRDLSAKSARARAAAAHALGDVVDDTEKRRAVPMLIGALDDDRPEVRMEACSSLGELADTAAVPGLIKRLDDGSPPVRQNAAIALGTIKHADAFDPLAQALREGPADLRFQAATSLAEIDGRRAFDLLIPALGDRDAQVSGAAALAVGALPGELDDDGLRARARTALLEHLDHEDKGARFDVAYALAELGDPAGRSVLANALPDEERAWDAVTSLARLGTSEDIAALSQALSDRRISAEATVLAAGSILRLIGDAPTGTLHQGAARRVLLAGLRHRKGHVRGLAIEQLTEVGGEWAIGPLEAIAKQGKNRDLLEGIAGALDAIAQRGRGGPAPAYDHGAR